MTVDIGPNRGIAVEIPLAGRIPQPRSLTRNNKQWVMVGYRPFPHLGKRVPDMPFLPFLCLLKIRCHKENLVHNKAAKATKIYPRPQGCSCSSSCSCSKIWYGLTSQRTHVAIE